MRVKDGRGGAGGEIDVFGTFPREANHLGVLMTSGEGGSVEVCL